MESKPALSSSTHASATEKHLEDIVWVHSSGTPTLLDLFDVFTGIKSLSFLRIGENRVGFSYVFEDCFSILDLLFALRVVFVRVPLDCLASVRFLDFSFICALLNTKNLVVVLSFALFQLQLRVPYFLL